MCGGLGRGRTQFQTKGYTFLRHRLLPAPAFPAFCVEGNEQKIHLELLNMAPSYQGLGRGLVWKLRFKFAVFSQPDWLQNGMEGQMHSNLMLMLIEWLRKLPPEGQIPAVWDPGDHWSWREDPDCCEWLPAPSTTPRTELEGKGEKQSPSLSLVRRKRQAKKIKNLEN